MKKIKLKRAQGVIEFLVVFGAIIFFFVSFFAVVQKNIGDRNSEKQRIILQDIALNVQEEINIAAKSSEGYTREFNVPTNLLGDDYEINITDNSVYATFGKHGVSYKIPNVTGEIFKGDNLIKKENGSVYLNLN